jgi:hypothetical protein
VPQLFANQKAQAAQALLGVLQQGRAKDVTTLIVVHAIFGVIGLVSLGRLLRVIYDEHREKLFRYHTQKFVWVARDKIFDPFGGILKKRKDAAEEFETPF